MTHVLFIEDDKVTQKLVKGILDSSGYSVIACSDAITALDQTERERFDLFLVDANLPGGISGFDFVRTIRAQDKYSKTPIAILTGRREKKDIEQGLQSGADDYIIKPIDPHILLGKLESLVKKRSADLRPTSFAERAVRQSAEFDIDMQVVHVSERGLTLWSPLVAPPETKIKIKSSFFQTLGISAPILRIVSYNKDPSNAGMFFINTVFIGVNDSELQKIRMWVSSAPAIKPKAG